MDHRRPRPRGRRTASRRRSWTQLTTLGFDATEIEAVRSHFVASMEFMDVFDPSLTLPDHVRRLADTIDASVDGFDAFGRELAAVGRPQPARRRAATAPPTASFTATPSAGQPPLAVAFDASASSDAEGPIASYAWDFGDGTTASGATAEHTYTAAGSFTATLTVTDGAGQTATTTQAIVVSDGPNVPPVAVATATPAVGPAPLTVSLSGEGSSDADGTITSYVWSFPDGSTLIGPVVQATLAAAGHGQRHVDRHRRRRRHGDDDGRRPGNRATRGPLHADARRRHAAARRAVRRLDEHRRGGHHGYAWSFGDGATGSRHRRPPHLRDGRLLHRDADGDRHRRPDGPGHRHRGRRRRQPATGRRRR